MRHADLADAVGVSAATLSRWLSAKNAPQGTTVAKLVAWAESRPPLAEPPPVAVPADYWRGVLYAAEAMVEVTHRLLREAREADEQTVRQTVKAALFETLPASESVHRETSSAAGSTAPPRGKAKRA